jgi:hypothetical protein
MNMSNELDDLLDMTLDDLADLPEFKPYPAGVHRAKATMEIKEINKKKAVELSFKYVSCEELADDTEATPAADDVASCMYFLDNEFGQGGLKKVAVPLGEALQLTSLGEIIGQTVDIDCIIVTNIQTDKTDETKRYMRIVDLAVV